VRFSDLEGRRVLVLGTGREARSFAEAAAPAAGALFAIDARDGESARAWRERWGARAPLTIASTAAAFAGQIDVAVTSPGIPPHDPLRASLVEAGIPVSMPTDIWLGEHADRTTGVTGSKGKSTTSALIHALLSEHGMHSELGGNIGRPVFDLPKADRYVVEFSSYQASTVTRSPDVAVLTALFPEHLDWHGGERAYVDAKLNLFAHGTRRIVANGEDDRVRAELAGTTGVEFVGPGHRWELATDGIRREGRLFIPVDGWRLRGRHNALNATLALAAMEAGGADPVPVTSEIAMLCFAPLEHRLEPIPDPSGLTFVDDSLSTAPQATIRALEAFPDEPVVLLLGGHDRGVDYAPLAERLRAHPVVALIGLPGSGAEVLARVAPPGVPAEAAEDMTDAVARARRLAPHGGIVLLSPAAPSYGRYADYRERSADFRRAIEATAPR
jgi:UDP-N-acetylmuramoylalanine--D-glutamate ligase